LSNPEGWDKFLSSLLLSRPWEVNSTTSEILRIINQEDVARVVYALFRSGSAKFLNEPNRDLNNKSPVELLKSEDGAEEVRQFLMCNPWL
jgi:uncharacterized protein (DUF2384 family)